MKTVEEILRESGLTDEQIKALDAKVLSGFTQVVSTAAQTLEQAENAKRLQAQQYETEIAPALDNWANEKATYDAKIAAYDAALKSAAEGGFKVPDLLKPAAPTVVGDRNANGQFVAGANKVPGSPQYMTREDGFKALSAGQWFITEYMRLHNGAVPPEDFATVASEAGAQRMDFKAYVEKKYEFQKKRDEIKAAADKKHDDEVAAKAVADNDKKWAERVGNNPNIRQAEVSRFSTLEKGVKDGTRPDPLKMNREQRHAATRNVIQKEIAENATVQ